MNLLLILVVGLYLLLHLVIKGEYLLVDIKAFLYLPELLIKNIYKNQNLN